MMIRTHTRHIFQIPIILIAPGQSRIRSGERRRHESIGIIRRPIIVLKVLKIDIKVILGLAKHPVFVRVRGKALNGPGIEIVRRNRIRILVRDAVDVRRSIGGKTPVRDGCTARTHPAADVIGWTVGRRVLDLERGTAGTGVRKDFARDDGCTTRCRDARDSRATGDRGGQGGGQGEVGDGFGIGAVFVQGLGGAEIAFGEEEFHFGLV